MFTTITDPLGDWSTPEGISSGGTIVGGYSASGAQHAFMLNGSYTTIDVPNTIYSIATGISESGSIIVGDSIASAVNGPHVGFVLQNGVYASLDVPGAVDTIPMGVNDAGDVVGVYADATGYHGFLAVDPPDVVPEPSSILIFLVSMAIFWFTRWWLVV